MGHTAESAYIKRVKNYMGASSFTHNPLTTLKIVSASSIFAEPRYYQKTDGQKIANFVAFLANFDESVFASLSNDEPTVEDVFTTAIDQALDFDFEATLQFAVQLRQEYNMRLNPSVIFIRAAIHPGRKAFTDAKSMIPYALKISARPDDMEAQLKYYESLKGSAKGLPMLVKRAWTKKLEEMSAYQIAKYKSNLMDVIRLSNTRHLRDVNPSIETLVSTGTLSLDDEDSTWEKLSSQGKSFKEIFETLGTKFGHMALLRNLRNFEDKHGTDTALLDAVAKQLIAGVVGGKQFPYRYYTAYSNVTSTVFKDALEECMYQALSQIPSLAGRTACLSDNSGSAHGALTSEYGSTAVNQIANLSSLMTAMTSSEGWVGIFGDDLKMVQASMNNRKMLAELKRLNQYGDAIGHSTENGVWLFWKDAIENKVHWDNVFIYSDMQAGHGGLYGKDAKAYKGHVTNGNYIDVISLVNEYRATVNPDVNVFTVQVAGYSNSILPETAYRTAILGGWTGKEVIYANEMIEIWNAQK
jgi:60 kDa SS-A/Ro ribonucleoprotein